MGFGVHDIGQDVPQTFVDTEFQNMTIRLRRMRVDIRLKTPRRQGFVNVLCRNGYNDRFNTLSLPTSNRNPIRIADAILSHARICYKLITQNRAASAEAVAALEYDCELRAYFTVAYMKYL